MRAPLLLAALLSGCGAGRGGAGPNGDDNVAPIANAGVDLDGAPAQSLGFDGSGSSDPDGTIESYTWNFGDGSVGADDAVVSHSFATAGTYAVVLTVTDDGGKTASDGLTVQIASLGPVASFTVSPATSVDVGVPLSFDASASTAPGTIVAYRWSFGDSSPAATGAQVQHSYAFAGSFKVSVEVEDDNASTATDERWVTVTDGGSGLTIADVQGVYDIVATPPSRTCQSYSVSVLDTIITLGGGGGSCSSGEEAAAATGASGNPYSGCLASDAITLSYDGPSAVQASALCATTLTHSLSLSFDAADHFTGTATSFYSGAIGCTCSAIFSLTGTRR